MRKLFSGILIIGGVILVFQSCSDTSVLSTEEIVAEKKEEFLEKASALFPKVMTDLYEEQIDTDSTNIDSLEIVLDDLIETISEYSTVEEFKNEVKGQYEALSNQMAAKGLPMQSVACTNNLGLGFSRSAEVYGGVSAGAAFKVAAKLEASGGGGTEYIYDFMNMDRGVYTYSFCKVSAGIGVGYGADFGGSVGFTGLKKWIWNIKPGQKSIRNRFEGAGKSYAIGLSGDISAVFGIDGGVSLGYAHEMEWSGADPQLDNMASCPEFMSSRPLHDGAKEAIFAGTAGVSSGKAFEVVALFQGENSGVFRSFIDEGYNDFSSKYGRLGSSLKMAKELIIPEPIEFLRTGGIALTAAATVTVLGAFNPNECPLPNQVPNISGSGLSYGLDGNINLQITISDNGGEPVTSRGVCWSEEYPPTLTSDCKNEGSGMGELIIPLNELVKGKKYYVRAFASNNVGTGYGRILDALVERDTEGWQRDTATEVVEVTNPITGRTWMDRNLGASRVAISPTDEEAYGDLYQWGRPADGHQKRNSSTTGELSTNLQPNHDKLIMSRNSTNDWLTPQNDTLWQGVYSTNNPCPLRYRIPTLAEWTDEIESWDSLDADGAFESPLKFTLAGSRYRGDLRGAPYVEGESGNYWTSNVENSHSKLVYIQNYVSESTMYRAKANSVRCIKD